MLCIIERIWGPPNPALPLSPVFSLVIQNFSNSFLKDVKNIKAEKRHAHYAFFAEKIFLKMRRFVVTFAGFCTEEHRNAAKLQLCTVYHCTHFTVF